VTLTNSTTMASDSGTHAPILEIEHLDVRLRTGAGTLSILDDVSYSIAEGEAVAIVGESGAGKSVSTRAILDLLDRRKFDVEGTIRLAGTDLSTLSRKQRRMFISNNAALVFQDPTRALNPSMRIGKQITEAMIHVEGRNSGLSKEDADAKALELMREVGIADPAERFRAYPHQLSGGMRQRIMISTAIACSPKILFCDEPTSSLDVTTQAVIMDLLQQLQSELNMALVLITHDLSLAASRVNHVMVMYQGRLVEDLPSKDLVRNASMPYTQALLRAVPSARGDIPEPIPSLPFRPRDEIVGCPYAPICPRAQDVCKVETPPLVELSPNHRARCFFPGPDDQRKASATP
jgi:oligopeptide/dipeptide ABC transporter ATP-binding protein